VALDFSGNVYTWGEGQGGLLGHGNLESRSTPMIIEAFKVMNLVIE